MSYQGVLTDGSGNLVPDGNYDIRFRLYDAEVAGNVLWTEQHNGAPGAPPLVVVSKGGFSVTLGTQVTLPPFNNPFWLEITVSPNPPIAPRTQLTSAPYSLNTRNIYDGGTNDFVGIGRSTRLTTAEYFGVLAPVTSGYGGMYVKTDGASALPFYGYATGGPGGSTAWTYLDGNDDSWKVYNSGTHLVLTKTGNLGLGTHSPDSRLEVNGSTKLGSNAPPIRMKKLSGATAATEGGSVAIPTGIADASIISVQVLVTHSGSGHVPPAYTLASELHYSWIAPGDGTIVVTNSPTNSANILSKPITILVTYEE